MNIQGFYTNRGLDLAAKLLSGHTLNITRVVAGSGITADPENAAALADPRQELAVNSPVSNGATATIPATLTAAQADASYTLTELGIYAADPEEGEILYKLYRTESPIAINNTSGSVLRFYLEETLSDEQNISVICSPEGLVTEEMLSSVQERLLSSAVPERTVELSADEFPAYISALPRLLSERLTVTVTGTLNLDQTALIVRGLHGAGSLTVRAEETGAFSLTGMLEFLDCSVPVCLKNITWQAPANLSKFKSLLTFSNCASGRAETCTFTGNDLCRAVCADHSSRISLRECRISHFDNTLLASNSSVVTVHVASADHYRNNQIGAYVYQGGIILLSGTVCETLGGSYNTKQGGIIAATTGTLL